MRREEKKLKQRVLRSWEEEELVSALLALRALSRVEAKEISWSLAWVSIGGGS